MINVNIIFVCVMMKIMVEIPKLACEIAPKREKSAKQREKRDIENRGKKTRGMDEKERKRRQKSDRQKKCVVITYEYLNMAMFRQLKTTTRNVVKWLLSNIGNNLQLSRQFSREFSHFVQSFR